MKSPVSPMVCLFLAFVGVAAADLPKKAPISRYSGLWNNSPFTSKPPVDDQGPNNPLDDYSLIGISPIGGNGHRVTLINKKATDERIIVDFDSDKSGFKILSIERKAGDPLATIVRMSKGATTGSVTFDEKLLTLSAAKAAPAKPAAAPPGQPVQPGQPQPQPQPGQPQRQPRPRVVPPPTANKAAAKPTAPPRTLPSTNRAIRRGN